VCVVGGSASTTTTGYGDSARRLRRPATCLRLFDLSTTGPQ
jgi:hypothetical protein